MTHTPESAMIAPDNISVDFQYQRPLNESHVAAIVSAFDPLALGSITVNQRTDNTVYVLDGQHRLAALKQMGRGREPTFCLLYRGLSVGEEADVYFMQSKAKPIHPVDLWRARLFAAEPVALAIQAILNEFSIAINNQQRHDYIQAPGAIEKIFVRHGKERLRTVAHIVTNTWHEERRSLPGYLFLGVNAFLSRYDGQYDQDRLIGVLSSTPKPELEEIARSIAKFTSDTQAGRYGRAILHIYNKGLRKKLDDWDQRRIDLNTEQIQLIGNQTRFQRQSA